MRGGREYRPIVVLQSLQPGADVSGRGLARFRRDSEIGEENGAADLPRPTRVNASNYSRRSAWM
jgi:hypothetical protein